MPTIEFRYNKLDAARRSDEIYDRDIRAKVEPLHNGEIVALDLISGAWTVDPDQDTAADNLTAKVPSAQIIVLRVGTKYIARFGCGRSTVST